LRRPKLSTKGNSAPGRRRRKILLFLLQLGMETYSLWHCMFRSAVPIGI